MNSNKFTVRKFLILGLFFKMTTIHAGIPVWTFTPLTPTTLSVSDNGSASVRYRVTNQSRRPHTLSMIEIQGITQNTTNGFCQNPFYLNFNESCILNLNVSGAQLQGNVLGGPIVCEGGNPNQCYRPNDKDALSITRTTAPIGNTTLGVSVNNLALLVNDTGLNPALTGNSRTITITNTGSTSATNLSLQITPPIPLVNAALPTGTTTSTTCGATLAAGASCSYTITPGVTPSSAGSNDCRTFMSKPLPSVLEVTADNATTISANIYVLSYACQYQGGFLFSIDDTTPVGGSIGGKAVANPGDSSGSYLWSTIYTQTLATSITNGSTNSNLLSAPAGQYPAAQACLNLTSEGYSDWTLPAICELGADESNSGSGCGTNASPLIQNLTSSFVLGSIDPLGLTGYGLPFWSSTETTIPFFTNSWAQDFGMDTQLLADKISSNYLIVCTRSLTP